MREVNLSPSVLSKSGINQQDVFHLPDRVFSVWRAVCERDEGAVRGAEQVWKSHSGTSTHFCSVANSDWFTLIFPATLAHPPTAGRCDCSSLSPTPLCSLIIFISTPCIFLQLCVISVSCFWFHRDSTLYSNSSLWLFAQPLASPPCLPLLSTSPMSAAALPTFGCLLKDSSPLIKD